MENSKIASGSLVPICKLLNIQPNGQNSSWENVNAWVPQSSILGPLLCLI